MFRQFIESTKFTKWLLEHWSDEEYSKFQWRLMDDPDAGTVIPGTGGIRKLRVDDPKRRQGKRGRSRIIYLHMPEAETIVLLAGFDKAKAIDLSPDEKKALKRYADQIKAELLGKQRIRKGRKGRKGRKQ